MIQKEGAILTFSREAKAYLSKAVGLGKGWIRRNTVAFASAMPVIAFLLTSATQHATAQNKKRLIAYYLYSDQTKTPAYTAKDIPFKKLTHLIHVAVVVSPAADGSIEISKNAIESQLIPKAHKAKVPVLVCVQGPANIFSRSQRTQPPARVLETPSSSSSKSIITMASTSIGKCPKVNLTSPMT